MNDPTLLYVTWVAKTDPGRDPDKQVNEDAYGSTAVEGTFLAVLCDGMGGHSGGREASHAAVDTILAAIGRPATPELADDASTRGRLERALQLASAAVHRLGADKPPQERPGATCVAAWLHRDSLEVAYAGDSRCYLWRAGTLRQLTRDHTVVEAWIEAGRMTHEQAKGHPEAHRITRALGIHPTVEVDFIPTEILAPADKLLLCSDGLTDLVTPDELAQHLGRTERLSRVANDLVELANSRGGHDNITVVLLQVLPLAEGGALPDRTPDNWVQADGAQCQILSKRAVASGGTEQFHGRIVASDRTQAMTSTDRTVIMPEVVGTPARGSEGGARDTQPLVPRLAPSGVASSIAPGAPSLRRLWFALAVCLLVVFLAIVVRLLRR